MGCWNKTSYKNPTLFHNTIDDVIITVFKTQLKKTHPFFRVAEFHVSMRTENVRITLDPFIWRR